LILNKHELEIINIYGRMFALRRSKNFGRIFALLQLKAKTEKNGLDQHQIMNLLNNHFPERENISVSTVSRTLSKMTQAEYCKYKEGKRGKRKYYSHGSFKDLWEDRIEQNFREFEILITDLNKIKKNLLKEESQGDDDLLNFLKDILMMYEAILELYQDFILMVKERLSEI
jgi:DNA-binding transcriptional regulator GbsR (MarR family)